ncbi:MAG: hypothetical protein ACREDV_01380 [Methylocella sp.]
MPHYCVWPTEGTNNYLEEIKNFWVLATSDDEAKRLVALNVPSIGTDVTKLGCVADQKFAPPPGVIMTDSGETFTVSKR